MVRSGPVVDAEPDDHLVQKRRVGQWGAGSTKIFGGVKHQLEQVRQGQVIHIEGFLVDASRSDGWHWNTSMTRDDTGAGACELIYVESIGVVAP